MGSLDAEDVQRFAEAVDRVSKMQERLMGLNAGNSTITVHHDGKGTWIAVTAALMMFVMNVGLAFLYLDLRRSQDRSEDYIQTTYMLVPGLKKLVDEELDRRNTEEKR